MDASINAYLKALNRMAAYEKKRAASKDASDGSRIRATDAAGEAAR